MRGVGHVEVDRALGVDALVADQDPNVDEIDVLRARLYGGLAAILGQAPDAGLIEALRGVSGNDTPLGQAHAALADAAAEADLRAVERDYFELFIGVGRGKILPYASYYLTGFLNERPLARLREDLARLGIERDPRVSEPEDHIAILLEVMAALAERRFGAESPSEQLFFERHLKPWARRLFEDIETEAATPLYRAVGALGRSFIEIETAAFAIDA
ncbi:TorD/DmsD family molecular chaperone [Methylobacterium sp. WSM2598]|uniref:TorD/DmsD family molecular chaperone n=1 Tax=Methylobacterium sp. WSM2598 TaxID=398261 RepID=UPI003FA5B19E